MRLIVGFANVLMTMVFLASAAVQYNDPDALSWIVLYAAAAACCIAFTTARLRSWMAGLLAVLALVWSVFLLPQFAGQVTVGEVFGSLTMKTKAVELAREFGGLLIVAAWMGFLALVGRRYGVERSVDGQIAEE